MKRMILAGALVLAGSLNTIYAQGAQKIGIINLQRALVGTKDGQKAAADLESRMTPKRKALEGKQGEIQQLRERFSKTSNTVSEDERNRMARDIDTRTKAFNRDVEDAESEMQVAQNQILQEMVPRLQSVVDKYAKDNGYTLVIDVSSQASPVLFASDGADITNEVIAMYDKNAPAAGAPSSGTRPATQGVAPAGVRPVAPAAVPRKP